jgi:hypothetical protein
VPLAHLVHNIFAELRLAVDANMLEKGSEAVQADPAQVVVDVDLALLVKGLGVEQLVDIDNGRVCRDAVHLAVEQRLEELAARPQHARLVPDRLHTHALRELVL